MYSSGNTRWTGTHWVSSKCQTQGKTPRSLQVSVQQHGETEVPPDRNEATRETKRELSAAGTKNGGVPPGSRVGCMRSQHTLIPSAYSELERWHYPWFPCISLKRMPMQKTHFRKQNKYYTYISKLYTLPEASTSQSTFLRGGNVCSLFSCRGAHKD